MENRPSTLRKWSEEAMSSAYNEIKAGRCSISAASKRFGVPRMTLSDRVHGKVSVKSTMGVSTALTVEEELALINYITYMANRGFPLSIEQVKGFAWCIAKEHGRGDVFTKKGPSKQWWKGFKTRHPDLGLRRPDSLDRGRATLGTVIALRDYFALLKDTLDSNGLTDKPERIYNCDEAALFLNKSAGQKVVVPSKMKHAHSLSVATSEHISVHCCVNAAGNALPPMIIFTNSLPGGPYHRQGPINASYASSESGFMDKTLYLQWFEKTFLGQAVPQRPLLLIQDGASSHISVQLVRSAIANDVILLCLPPKTTHITQPLDVAVYRKMKIETAKAVSQAKMLKSDLWISKKTVSAMFKVIFEKSFTIDCITEGFRKCGIYPFNPNAVDKTLLLRASTEVDPTTIDLSSRPSPTDESIPSQSADTPTVRPEVRADDQVMLDVSFVVGDDGVLAVDPGADERQMQSDNNNEDHDNIAQDCPPELALAAIECSLTPRKKRKFKECYEFNVDLPDKVFKTWRYLKEKMPNLNDDQQTDATEAQEVATTHATSSEVLSVKQPSSNLATEASSTSAIISHPLVKAGLIPQDLVDVLVVPTPKQKSTSRSCGKSRVLTSSEVQQELEEKEAQRIELAEQKEKRKHEREEKRVQREKAILEKKKEIQQRKEMRETLKAEKQKIKDEKAKLRKAKKTNKTKETVQEQECKNGDTVKSAQADN